MQMKNKILCFVFTLVCPVGFAIGNDAPLSQRGHLDPGASMRSISPEFLYVDVTFNETLLTQYTKVNNR